MLDEPNVTALFGAVLAQLQNPHRDEFISAKDIYTAGLAAGLDMSAADAGRRAPTMEAMNKSFALQSLPDKHRALTSIVKSLMTSGKENARNGANVLNNFGVAWDGNNIVKAGVLDERERAFLPPTSADDLAKAVDRLTSGDESGAISAACGAVDLATGAAYEE